MRIMKSEWTDRVQHWIRTLQEDFYRPLGEINWKACSTMEHITPKEAMKKNFVEVETGYVWGKEYEYCWFAGEFDLPQEAKGRRIVLHLNPGGESSLFVNGKEFGTYRADWIKKPHHYFVDNTLTSCAKGNEHFSVLMETYAGHFYPEADCCTTGPVLPGAFEDRAVEGKRRILGTCTYGIWNEEAYQLYMDVETLCGLLKILDESSLRAAHIADALEKFTLEVDFEQEYEGRQQDYRKARAVLRSVLEAVNGSTAPKFYAIGNAHIDLAWLWPMRETYRKTERTFAAQLRHIEEYPEYKFIQSQPAVYEMCREYYPELFAKIQEAIKQGQWIAEGAMWVEPDTNMASGEALIRQLLYGKRYYKEYFDVDSQILWLPDTFGYSAVLPQILQGCDVKYLVTQKIFWSYNEGEQFPYHYFYWEGMDGSRVESFLPTSYTYDTDPVTINETWKNRSQARDLEAFLLPYGYGDGGGGPTRDHIEYIQRQHDLEGGAKVQFADPKEFFEDMDAMGGPKNTYVGELYFSAHRGTYTSQAMVKRNNRKCEFALREAELWSTFASEKGFAYPREELEKLWKKLLMHQFHDILPGSGIGIIYKEAEIVYQSILQECTQLTERALAVLTQNDTGVTVFNSLGFERNALIALPEEFEGGAVTTDGVIVPVETRDDGTKALVRLPSCGAVTVLPWNKRDNGAGQDCLLGEVKLKSAASVRKTGNMYLLQNEKVRVLLNERGEITSFVLKESEREFAEGVMNHLQMYKDVARKFDAWDIDSNYIRQEVDGSRAVIVEILSAGGLKAELRVRGEIGDSAYEQKISLTAQSTRVEIAMTVDWREQHRLLKVAFPVAVYSEEAINEIQFGYVKRPTHRSRAYDQDRFEVCNHRYSALCDGAHGAAVLNDSKYGISMNGNSLELSLLKAACSPEMRADNGIHHFTYAFTAWEGNFADSDVIRQGYELNTVPVLYRGIGNQMNFRTDHENIILEVVKLSEDNSGDWIVRLYESKKAAVRTVITMPAFRNSRVFLCNMLEEKGQEIQVKGYEIVLDFRAFEIKTLRICKK